jgi:hypothetical protein
MHTPLHFLNWRSLVIAVRYDVMELSRTVTSKSVSQSSVQVIFQLLDLTGRVLGSAHIDLPTTVMSLPWLNTLLQSSCWMSLKKRATCLNLIPKLVVNVAANCH